jgi:hypothetical protein
MKKIKEKIKEYGYLPGAIVAVVSALAYIIYKFLELI